MITPVPMNKIDSEFIRICNRILKDGKMDRNPRPKYEDGTPAHTLSINHDTMSFDLSKDEFPIMSLRPVTWRYAIREILWIYQDASNDLKLLREKYNITWWDKWALPDDTIGACYGETVRRHNLMHDLLDGLVNDPDSRYHIMNLWQVEDFKEPHGLKPCCYNTVWNVRHEDDGDYLDMCMTQRSVDFAVAGSTTNQVQYAALLCLVANHCGYKPGVYTWNGCNIQLYNRHIILVKEMLKRDPIVHKARLDINPNKKDFYSINMDDIHLIGYPEYDIKMQNPQIKFELGI